MARSPSPIGAQVLALVDEIETDARIAAKAMPAVPAAELSAWVRVGSVPVMARACWADAQAVAERLQWLGQHIDVERMFRKTMGDRAFSILMTAVGRRSR